WSASTGSSEDDVGRPARGLVLLLRAQARRPVAAAAMAAGFTPPAHGAAHPRRLAGRARGDADLVEWTPPGARCSRGRTRGRDRPGPVPGAVSRGCRGRGGDRRAAPRAVSRPLGKNRDFQLLWAGQAISVLGSRTSQLAYPLLVLAMTGSAAAAGVVG